MEAMPDLHQKNPSANKRHGRNAWVQIKRNKPRAGRGRIRLRTIILIRWIAIGGQLASLLLVHFGLGYTLPLPWALACIGTLTLATIAAQFKRKRIIRLADREAASYFAFDMLQLAALLYLTGGLNNPFSILILAPVTVSAAALSYRSTLGLSILAIACISFLALYHLPLPSAASAFTAPPVVILALALALILAVIFIASYIFRVAEEARRISDALQAAQAALDREQRLSSLGALAAAAAHELGSPLGTIAIIAKELARDLPPDSPWKADAVLLQSQSDRCREILTDLARQPEGSSSDHFHMLPAPLIVEIAARPYLKTAVSLNIETHADSAGDKAPPLMPRRPEIVHGLGNLLQNALEFARTRVDVVVSWSSRHITVIIKDDGPGFTPDLLRRLGEPYVGGAHEQDESRSGDHMGLGIFIAQNLIERTGGSISFRNNPDRGAQARVIWPRSIPDHD